MSKFFLKLSICIVIILLFVPLFASAETGQEEELMQTIIRLLQIKIELLKTQLAFLTQGILLKPGVPVSETKECSQLEISWGLVQGVTGYRLYRDGAVIYEGRERSFVDSGLVPEKKYRYMVYGLYRGAEGAPSEVQEITAPDVCVPKIPKLNFKKKSCGGQVTVYWISDSEARVYQLFRGNREVYNGSLTQFADSGLAPNHEYKYKIRAGNEGGWSDFSDPVSVQASNVCAPSTPEVSFVIPELSIEGILSAELRSSPSDSTRVRPAATNRAVMAIKVEAIYSDIAIKKIDLFFDSQVWRYLDKIKVQYGGRTAVEEGLSRESFTRIGSEDIYRIRFANLQFLVRDGRSGTVTIKVDVKEFLSGTLPRYITVFLENNSIRGVDEANLQQYVPRSGGGKEGSFSRTFRIE